MRLRQIRKNTTLKADGKELVFKDGVTKDMKVTKSIQNLLDANYVKEASSETINK